MLPAGAAAARTGAGRSGAAAAAAAGSGSAGAGLVSRSQPSRRRVRPEADGCERPLVVAALQDKIVQRAATAVRNAIYEEEFLGFAYRARSGRSRYSATNSVRQRSDPNPGSR